MEETPEWMVDPDGREYRIHFDTKLPLGFRVEYKPVEPKRTLVLKPFIVKVRGEVWHVQAPTAEAAALFSWSDAFPQLPKRNEVEVETDKGGTSGKQRTNERTTERILGVVWSKRTSPVDA